VGAASVDKGAGDWVGLGAGSGKGAGGGATGTAGTVSASGVVLGAGTGAAVVGVGLGVARGVGVATGVGVGRTAGAGVATGVVGVGLGVGVGVGVGVGCGMPGRLNRSRPGMDAGGFWGAVWAARVAGPNRTADERVVSRARRRIGGMGVGSETRRPGRRGRGAAAGRDRRHL
jgi:hypothetical protein